MLVLSRQRDETIMIGDDIEITIVDIRGDKVRLGITAPTRIAVHRKEVYESITRENRQAATIAHGDLETLGGVSPGPARLREQARGAGISKLSSIAVGAAPARSSLKPTGTGGTGPLAPSVNQPHRVARGA